MRLLMQKLPVHCKCAQNVVKLTPNELTDIMATNCITGMGIALSIVPRICVCVCLCTTKSTKQHLNHWLHHGYVNIAIIPSAELYIYDELGLQL